jgi:hypothetical protein
MIDVVSDRTKDWNQVWLESPEHEAMLAELERLKAETSSTSVRGTDECSEFAMPLWQQTKIVTKRLNNAMFRNIGYVNNKFALHIITGLFTGFSFWQVGNSVADLQLRLFAVFNFIFVAPGVIGKFSAPRNFATC